MTTDAATWEPFMRLALEQAAEAPEHADIPVGAVLVNAGGEPVAEDRNRREQLGDATAHAEILVISQASRAQSSWRLEGHTLVVTLEPCAMCAMAAVWARVDRIVYAATDPKAGAAWSLYNIPQDARLNHRVDLVDGVLEAESTVILESFFRDRRRRMD